MVDGCKFWTRASIVHIVLVGLLFSKASCHKLSQKRTWPLRTVPGNIDFPNTPEFYHFASLLSGSILGCHDVRYSNATLNWNLRVIKSPFLIVYPQTIVDIQRSILFARHFNLHVSIQSSGHSFIGRSSFDGSLNINLSKMRDIKINLKSTRNPAGEITVQSGASWIEVYEKVNHTMGPDRNGQGMIGRVVVGGSAHTVAMGGYTQGGGHAPIARKFGLAVDNLLEATLVTAKGKVVTVSADKTITRDLNGTIHQSSDTSLFWAIRGGGGGTWGIVVSFTYKLHYAPERFRRVILAYPLFLENGLPVSRSEIITTLTTVNNLAEEWGGYVIMNGEPIKYTSYTGELLLILNHCGNDTSPSNKQIDDLINKTNPIYKLDQSVRTFMDYEITANDALHSTAYIANTFIQPSSITNTTTVNHLVDFLYNHARKRHSCTFTMIGGSVMKSNGRPSTPMHPAMRSGIFSATCSVSWNYNPLEDESHITEALDMAEELYPFGDGSYFNEPAEDMQDWKIRFWADHATYNRLLKIKQIYDPDNYFWCHNCIGSDLGHRYGPASGQGTPGKPPKDKYGNFDYTMKIAGKDPLFAAPIIG